MLNFVSGIRYLGEYLGPQAELEAWVKPQVEAWAHGVRVLAEISQRHPQSAYVGLGVSLQSEWQYLQRTVPGVGTLMGPIEEAQRETFSPSLFGREEITADFRKILRRSVKHGGLGIPDQRLSAESAYNTSKAASRELLDFLRGGSVLNYVGHRVCVRKASQTARAPQERKMRRGHPPSSMRSQRKACKDGGTQNCTDAPMGPPEQRAPPAHSMQGKRGEGGAGPQPKGEGEGTPQAGVHALCARPDTGDSRTPLRPAPPTQNKARGRG